MQLKNLERISQSGQRERNQIWNTLIQVYRDFANQSTIHGIKYTAQAKTATERLLWLTILIISLCCAAELANKFYERHESGNMRTTVVSDQFPSFKLPVPTVTLCHGNLVSAERLNHFLKKQKLHMPTGLSIKDFERGVQHFREIIYPYHHYPKELSNLQQILDANNISVAHLLRELSPKCMDVLLMCMYEGRIAHCDDVFVSKLTSYGFCCLFNSDEQNDLRISRKVLWTRNKYSLNFGTRYILSVLMKPYNASDRVAAITYSGGYKVLVHDKYTMPGPHSISFMLASTYETIVGLNGKQMTTSPEVLTLASKQRKCRPSTKENIYRLSNCYKECRRNMIYDRCKCVHYFSSELEPHQIHCNLTHIACLAKVMPDTYSLKLHSMCDCLPDCKGTEYTISITGQPFTAVRFRPGQFYRKAEQHPNSTALHVTFANQVSILERKELVLSWINLVSSLGGVFSLFLGCSFISIFEFVYFFSYRLIKKIQSKYTRNSVVINSE